VHSVPGDNWVVSLRVWTADQAPERSHGFAVRDTELAPVIAALVTALDRFRKRERRNRITVERAAGMPPRARSRDGQDPPPRAA
jgi:hypothetical protein